MAYFTNDYTGHAPASVRMLQEMPAKVGGGGAVSERRVVGINRYRSSKIPQLEYAEADARGVAKTLGRLGFPKRNVRVLEEDLNPKMGENDRLFLYFSGHGARRHCKIRWWL